MRKFGENSSGFFVDPAAEEDPAFWGSIDRDFEQRKWVRRGLVEGDGPACQFALDSHTEWPA